MIGLSGAIQLSLSRLNHRLPRAQLYPEVVQGTAEFHHPIADTLLPQANTLSGELLSILRDFRASWPDVRLELFPSSSVATGEQLRAQEVDVGFVYVLPTHFHALQTHSISVERIVLALPQTHPLVNRKRVRLGDLKGEPFVWFPRAMNPLAYDGLLSTCHAAGVTLHIVQEGNNPTTMLSLVAGGIGLSFTQQSAERRKPDNVVLREVEDLRLTLELSAIWREDNTVPTLPKFLEIVRKQYTGKMFPSCGAASLSEHQRTNVSEGSQEHPSPARPSGRGTDLVRHGKSPAGKHRCSTQEQHILLATETPCRFEESHLKLSGWI
jgi:DNA-binding transcriptional LysR family regulator